MYDVRLSSGTVRDLLGVAGVNTTTTGASIYKESPYGTFEAAVTGTGAVTATVIIDASNDNVNWLATPLGTITLSGTTSAADGFATQATWKWVRARVTAISGTGAIVVCKMGI